MEQVTRQSKTSVRGSNPRGEPLTVPAGGATVNPNNPYRAWVFTLNNPSDSNYDLLKLQDYQYYVLGLEVAESGTEHIQGYVYMKKRVRLAQMKRMLPRAHLEPARGTPQQNYDYCTKDGVFFEEGTMPDTIGGRSGGLKKADNYRRVIQQAKDQDMAAVLEENPVLGLQHYHALKRIQQDFPKANENLEDVCGIWYYGPPGVGKSHRAREENPSLYLKPANKWWDGYRYEDAVLIDDFDLSHKVLGHHLKLWADKWPFPAEQKGTTIQIRPKKLIITSNYSIDEIFNEDEQLNKAIKRRFNEVQMLEMFRFADHSQASQEDSDEPSQDLSQVF